MVYVVSLFKGHDKYAYWNEEHYIIGTACDMAEQLAYMYRDCAYGVCDKDGNIFSIYQWDDDRLDVVERRERKKIKFKR